MSLQIKFAILIAALAAAVLVALGASKWALDVTYREVREPIRSTSTVLSLLVDIENHVDSLRGTIDLGDSFRPEGLGVGGGSQERMREEFDAEFAAVERLLSQMNGEEWTSFAGRSATDNLTRKITGVAASGREQFAEGVEPDLGLLKRQLFQIHEILKKMERRVIDDMQQLAHAGADLRSRLGVVLGLALLLVALTAALALLLFRRWVVHPVAGLRTAAARIAAGDFEHRIPVPVPAPGDELTALSTEVNHMAGMVKQMQSERVEQERLAAIGEMVRRLAHNLRNPMAGIRGLAELTRSDVASLGPVASDVVETQNRIISTVDRFEGWLADLLNVTKPAQIHAEPTDVSVWLTGLVESHRALAQTKGVWLDLDLADGPRTATVDPRHLEHAVSAILSNAIEAAASSSAKRRGGLPPRVVVRSAICESGQNGKHGKSWELRVTDNGEGVPPDLRESIFKPYFTTKKDGNGIGLAVAQQVVRAHGGRIDVEDAGTAAGAAGTGSGAAFVLRLPIDGRLAPATEVARISHVGAPGGQNPCH